MQVASIKKAQQEALVVVERLLAFLGRQELQAKAMLVVIVQAVLGEAVAVAAQAHLAGTRVAATITDELVLEVLAFSHQLMALRHIAPVAVVVAAFGRPQIDTFMVATQAMVVVAMVRLARDQIQTRFLRLA